MFDSELWLPIEDIPGYYISNLGRVKGPRGIRKLLLDRCGYQVVSLYTPQKRVNRKIHRLVAQAFLPNPNNYEQVNHLDGNKTNNQVSNLEWCSNLMNRNHAVNVLKTPGGKDRVHLRFASDTKTLVFESYHEAGRYFSKQAGNLWVAAKNGKYKNYKVEIINRRNEK